MATSSSTAGLAERGHYPAINISQSVSRVAAEVTDADHQNAARKFRAIQATYAEVEDLIRIGAYVRGSNPQVDRAIELRQPLDYFLKQLPGEQTPFAEMRTALERIASGMAVISPREGRMKACFEFRLDQVLRLKQQRHKLAELRRREAQAARDAALAEVAKVQQRLALADKEWAACFGQAASVTAWVSRSRYRTVLEQNLQAVEAVVRAAEQALQVAAAARAAAAKEEETLIALRNQQRREHQPRSGAARTARIG